MFHSESTVVPWSLNKLSLLHIMKTKDLQKMRLLLYENCDQGTMQSYTQEQLSQFI